MILVGDCRAQLRTLDAGSVQTCITSPPYWGLRDYGVGGQIGLEPTPEKFVAELVDVFREVHRVLRDDGTLWMNLGDTYAGSRSGPDGGANTLGGGRHNQNAAKEGKKAARAIIASHRRDDAPVPRSDVVVPGLKPKQLIGVPWRVAFALQGFAVIPAAGIAQWADWLRQAREAGDWAMVQMVEDRMRACLWLDALAGAGWILRQDIIWAKPNPMPESINDRCTKAHEYLFLLAKSRRYYFDQDAIREAASANTHPRQAGNGQKSPGGWDRSVGEGGHGGVSAGRYGPPIGKGTVAARAAAGKTNGVGWGYAEGQEAKPRTRKVQTNGDATKNNASFDEAMAVMPDSRNKRSVWSIPTQAFSEAHFATFPEALVEPCILAGSRPGDLVLDPFMGAGTTAVVAERLSRRWVGCELNPEYAAIAEARIRNTHPGLPL